MKDKSFQAKRGGGTYLVFCLLLISLIICAAAFSQSAANFASAESGADDAEFYAPPVLKTEYWWWVSEGRQSITENSDGSVHIFYDGVDNIIVRTTSQTHYKLDGLHIKFKNFSGGGMGLAFSNLPSPDAYDSAFRLFACNGSDYTAVMRYVTPDWNNRNHKLAGALETKPMASEFDIKVEKAASGWNVIFAGQTFTFTDEEINAAIPNKDEVYVTFTTHPSYFTAYAVDVVSAHDGGNRCGDTLTQDEIARIASVNDKINAIGKVTASAQSKEKIDAANAAFAALDEELKVMVKSVDLLTYANQNYYALTTPASFDENNIISNVWMITDNHLETNDCTSYDDGSPQDRFEKAIAMICERDADAILLGGDITDWARFDETPDLSTAKRQIGMFKSSMERAWNKEAALFFTMGNHDSSLGEAGTVREQLFYELLGNDYYAWDVNRDDPMWDTGFRHAVIGGFHYLTMSWDYADEYQNVTPEAVEWMDEKLREITSSPDYDGAPIFFLSHVPFGNTVYGSEDMGERKHKFELYDVMKKYPQIVTLSGHSHYPLDNEKFIYQSDFTHIGAATTSYIGMPGDGFVTDGGYKVGGALMPADLIQSMGIRLEIDGDYNIRVTRIDFLHDGRQMYESVVIPAPDLSAKTHLNYFGEARASRVAAPAFGESATVVADYVSDKDTEVTFDTCTSEGVVQYYIIDFEHDDTVTTFKSYAAAWRYASNADVPKSKTVFLENFAPSKPYTVSVRAVDSFGNESNALTAQYVLNPTLDKVAAVTVDRLIAKIGTVAEANTQNYLKAQEAFDALTFEQKKMVERAAELKAAQAAYRNLYITLEQYEHGATVKDTVVGTNYWTDTGWLTYGDDEQGIAVSYNDSEIGVRMGLKAFDLDGLHLTFDGLEKSPDMKNDPSIGIILGGTAQPQYTEPQKTGILLFLDTNLGKLEVNPGFGQIIKSEALKYRNLKNKRFELKFSALEDGSYLVELNGLRGVLDKKYLDGSFSLKDPSRTYISLANWVQSGTFTYRLIAAHDKSSECAGNTEISRALLGKIETLNENIGALGNITLSSENNIVAAETAFASVPQEFRYLVKNADALERARAELDALKAQNGGDDQNGDNNGGEDASPKKKCGCGGEAGGATSVLCALLLCTVFAVILSRRNYKIRRK